MSRYVREKQQAGRQNEPRASEVGFMACAGCKGKANSFLTLLEPVNGHPWPPIPICPHCYAHYRALPSRQAADQFVGHLTEEMTRRTRRHR